MRYEVNVNVMIQEAPESEDGKPRYTSSSLSYYKRFTLTGDKFADLAPRIDAVVEAMDLVGDHLGQV